MPAALSYDGLLAHLQENSDRSRPEDRVYFYDAHTYYQLDNEEALEAAKAFKELMQERFKSGSNFYYGPTHTKPVGPHYEGQFKIVFTRHNYTELVNWLVLHRPLGLSLLIHPHTLDAAVDHTHRAIWVGPSYKVKTAKLEESAAKWKQQLEDGADEADLLWRTHV